MQIANGTVETDILIDFDINNEIYIDHSNDHTSENSPLFKQDVTWGADYICKPVCQVDFENNVKSEIEKICSAQPETGDKRPRLKDLNSGHQILVDSGAACSIWPASDFKNLTPDPTKFLKAFPPSLGYIQTLRAYVVIALFVALHSQSGSGPTHSLKARGPFLQSGKGC